MAGGDCSTDPLSAAPASLHLRDLSRIILRVDIRSILHRIAAKGYAVRLQRQDGKVCAEAILLTDPAQHHISRTFDGDSEEEIRRAVESLAVMVGIALHEF